MENFKYNFTCRNAGKPDIFALSATLYGFFYSVQILSEDHEDILISYYVPSITCLLWHRQDHNGLKFNWKILVLWLGVCMPL